MDTNLTAHYLAIQTDRTRLLTRAEQGWLADQAAAAPHPSNPLPVRRWIGAALVAAGARLQGIPASAPMVITPSSKPVPIGEA